MDLLFRDVILFLFLSSLYFQMSQKLVFDPYEYEQGRVLLNNSVNDPDCNFFNGVISDSKNRYVCESEISSYGTDGSFSITHINCRSLLHKKYAALYIIKQSNCFCSCCYRNMVE